MQLPMLEKPENDKKQKQDKKYVICVATQSNLSDWMKENILLKKNEQNFKSKY